MSTDAQIEAAGEWWKLRGGPGLDYPCFREGVTLCAMSECQLQSRCRLDMTPIPSTNREEARAALAAAQAAGATTLPLTPAGEAAAAAIRDEMRRREGFTAGIEAAAKDCEREAEACITDIRSRDELGARLAHARSGALLTAAMDIRALRPPSCASEDKPAPNGYVLIPIEPTYEMLAAGRDADRACELETRRRFEEENMLIYRTENVGKVYAAMIAAGKATSASAPTLVSAEAPSGTTPKNEIWGEVAALSAPAGAPSEADVVRLVKAGCNASDTEADDIGRAYMALLRDGKK